MTPLSPGPSHLIHSSGTHVSRSAGHRVQFILKGNRAMPVAVNLILGRLGQQDARGRFRVAEQAGGTYG